MSPRQRAASPLRRRFSTGTRKPKLRHSHSDCTLHAFENDSREKGLSQSQSEEKFQDLLDVLQEVSEATQSVQQLSQCQTGLILRHSQKYGLEETDSSHSDSNVQPVLQDTTSFLNVFDEVTAETYSAHLPAPSPEKHCEDMLQDQQNEKLKEVEGVTNHLPQGDMAIVEERILSPGIEGMPHQFTILHSMEHSTMWEIVAVPIPEGALPGEVIPFTHEGKLHEAVVPAPLPLERELVINVCVKTPPLERNEAHEMHRGRVNVHGGWNMRSLKEHLRHFPRVQWSPRQHWQVLENPAFLHRALLYKQLAGKSMDPILCALPEAPEDIE